MIRWWFKLWRACQHHYHETGNTDRRPVASVCAFEKPTEEYVEGKCCKCGELTWRPNPRYEYGDFR